MRGWLPLDDLLLADRDRLAPPAFVAGLDDVLPIDVRAAALTVANGESQVGARAEVGGMLLPRLPLVACRAPADGDHHQACDNSGVPAFQHGPRPPQGASRLRNGATVGRTVRSIHAILGGETPRIPLTSQFNRIRVAF